MSSASALDSSNAKRTDDVDVEGPNPDNNLSVPQGGGGGDAVDDGGDGDEVESAAPSSSKKEKDKKKQNKKKKGRTDCLSFRRISGLASSRGSCNGSNIAT